MNFRAATSSVGMREPAETRGVLPTGRSNFGLGANLPAQTTDSIEQPVEYWTAVL